MRGLHHPTAIRQRAHRLRRQGLSLDELTARLQIPKTTVQNWVHAIPLSQKARRRLYARLVDGGNPGRLRGADANRRKLDAWRQSVRERAASIASGIRLSPRWNRVLCAMLYLCEGSKYPAARCLGFGNSDPRLIRCFLRLFRQSFAVDERKFRCQIMHRWDQSLPGLIRYWSQATGMPNRQFYRNQADPRTRATPTLRKDYRGVCYVQYTSTDLQFTLQCLGEAVMKMVELEGVEPSSPPCHGGILPLNYSPAPAR